MSTTTTIIEPSSSIINMDVLNDICFCMVKDHNKPMILLPCKHQLHFDCAKQMQSDNCPWCRQCMNLKMNTMNDEADEEQIQVSSDIPVNGSLQWSIITGFGGGILTGWLANTHMKSSIMLGAVVFGSSCCLFINGLSCIVGTTMDSTMKSIRDQCRLVRRSRPPPSMSMSFTSFTRLQ